ncbi:MAG: transglycosylase SLT domain-containing protein [Epsilonproteobacteria bacterium]|nr:transglycosylase SLT domain-containing protein [Campylobacterota bacterium]
MIRFFLMMCLPMLLSANLIYKLNYGEKLSILNSFDIPSSFLDDEVFKNVKKENSTNYTNNHFFKVMSESYVFIPAMKRVLNKYCVPKEFIYMAMAESHFSNKAYSNKNAAGIWQFMDVTAKVYGLKIDEYVDERLDIIKSTKAAAQYLSYLHKKFGKWYLAAIAYNCGAGRLNRAIGKAKSDKIEVLLDPDKKYLPKETRFYIRKILALAIIAHDRQIMLDEKYKQKLDHANIHAISIAHLCGGDSLKRIARLIDIPFKNLEKLNRHLKYGFVPPYEKSYDIYIPYIKLRVFNKRYKKQDAKKTYKIHVVIQGDNLSNIGQKYGVSYRMIMDFNNLTSSKLRLKQKLVIPIEKVKISDDISYYMVKRGDTLESISKAHRISIQDIRIKNSIKGSLIKVGERLKIYE